MNEARESIFKIDEKLLIKILEFVKKQYKFFFGFFIGVVIMAFT